MVSVIVGEEKRVFSVHKRLLCSVSDYFDAALNGNFKEAAEQKIELLEDDPLVFERFQLWLYTKTVLDEDETVASLSTPNLFDLYIFVESRFMPKLQNHLVDLVIEKERKERRGLTPSDGDFSTKLTSSSPLWRLSVDMAARKGSLRHWSFDGYPRKYLTDVILSLSDLRKKQAEDDFHKTRCNYHVHAKDEPRCHEWGIVISRWTLTPLKPRRH